MTARQAQRLMKEKHESCSPQTDLQMSCLISTISAAVRSAAALQPKGDRPPRAGIYERARVQVATGKLATREIAECREDAKWMRHATLLPDPTALTLSRTLPIFFFPCQLPLPSPFLHFFFLQLSLFVPFSGKHRRGEPSNTGHL